MTRRQDELEDSTTGKTWMRRCGEVFGVALVSLLLLALVGGGLFRVSCVTFVDNYEIGYKYDRLSGKITVLDRTGYIIHRPVVDEINTIDGRPMQVCISAIERVLNCKLVQFQPEGLTLFLSWHGRSNYTNRGGSREYPTSFNQMLMAYAYDGSGTTYPFLHVVRELKAEEVK